MPTEADTCRTYVVPKLYDAGWADEQIREQVSFTDGRIIPAGHTHTRKPGKRADYILRYRPDLPIAVVEAKPEYQQPRAGLWKAMDRVEILGLRFGYGTKATVAYLDSLQAKVDELKRWHAESQKERDALMPSVLAKTFAGEL